MLMHCFQDGTRLLNQENLGFGFDFLSFNRKLSVSNKTDKLKKNLNTNIYFPMYFFLYDTNFLVKMLPATSRVSLLNDLKQISIKW